MDPEEGSPPPATAEAGETMSSQQQGSATSLAAAAAAAGSSSSSRLSYLELERKLNSNQEVMKSRDFRGKNKNLKTDIKLTTQFVKKVATVTDDSAQSLIKDVNEKLNLTRFVEEVVNSLVKAPVKIKDIEQTTMLCSAMHRSYEGFTELLIKSLLEQFDQSCKVDANLDKENIVRRRVLFRWLGELYLVGLLEDAPQQQQLVKIVRMITRAGSPPGPLPDPLPDTFPPLPDQACVNLFAVNIFLKSIGKELLFSRDVDFPIPLVKTRLIALFTAYCKGAISRLKEERHALRRIRRRVDNESLKRGEASSDTMETLERREKACEELYLGLVSLCEMLDIAKPPSPEELREEEESQQEAVDKALVEKIGLELMNRKRGGDAVDLSIEAWIFGDEQVRSFYEDLDDVAAVVPRMILERSDQALQPSVLERLKNTKGPTLAPISASETVSSTDKVEGTENPTATTEGAPSATATTIETDEVDNPDAIIADDDDDGDAATSSSAAGGSGKDVIKKVESVIRPVEELMARLPEMTSERACDNFARDFANHNSKSARKRLVQELFQVPWGRTELLPYYARLAATLSKLYTGIGRTLVDSVRAAFYKSTRDRRPGSRLSSRMRYAKYLGELVKFGLKSKELECPPAAAFRALKQTMDFFQGENIDMACALIESCGRELYRTPRTHPEIAKLLESLHRNRTARMLGPIHDAMVDNAYYHCIPPETASTTRKSRRERSLLEKYVRYLLIDKLGAKEVEGGGSAEVKPSTTSGMTSRDRKPPLVSKQVQETANHLTRLPWIELYEECEESLTRAFLAACKHRSGTLPMVCQTVLLLTKKFPRIACRMSDDLFELISLGLDQNDHRHNQRRIGQMKLLAGMLTYSLISIQTFYDVLFQVLHRGHDKPKGYLESKGLSGDVVPNCTFAQAHMYHPAVPSASDPPWDAFRVRLVCAALETCGDVVTSQANVSRLDLFVKYLERYVWNKAYFPVEIEFYMLDTLQELERKIADGISSAATKKKDTRRRSSAKDKKKKQAEDESATAEAGATAFTLVGRALDRQSAEDQVATLEGRGFQSELTVDTIIEEGDEEEEDEEGEEDDDEDDEEEEDEDDEMAEDIAANKHAVAVLPPPRLPLKPAEPTPEDLAFEAEFSKMMKETLEQSGKSNLGGAAIRGDNLVIPLNVLKKPSVAPPSKPSSERDEGHPSQPPQAGGVTLQLLKRGQNRKVEVKSLVVPDDSLLAKSASGGAARKGLIDQEEMAIKKLTLKAAEASRLRESGF